MATYRTKLITVKPNEMGKSHTAKLVRFNGKYRVVGIGSSFWYLSRSEAIQKYKTGLQWAA